MSNGNTASCIDFKQGGMKRLMRFALSPQQRRLIAHSCIQFGKQGWRERELSLDFDAVRNQKSSVKDDIADRDLEFRFGWCTEFHRFHGRRNGTTVLRSIGRYHRLKGFCHFLIRFGRLYPLVEERKHLLACLV